jgi:hypothetical protein
MSRLTRTIEGVAGPDEFDLLLGSWDVHNRRHDDERGWEEFPGRSTVQERIAGGRVQLDRFDAEWPTGQHVEALTVRAFDPGPCTSSSCGTTSPPTPPAGGSRSRLTEARHGI